MAPVPAKGEVSAAPKSHACSSIHVCCRCGVRLVFNRRDGWVHFGGGRPDGSGQRPAGGCGQPRHNPATCQLEAAA